MANHRHEPPEAPFTPAYVHTNDPEARKQDSNQQNSQLPPNPQGPQMPTPSELDAQILRKAQTNVLVASICAPVSLIIGGVLLGSVGLVFAILGFRKLTALAEKENDMAAVAKRIKRSASIAMVFCVVAIILNGISAWMMYPEIVATLQSGEYGTIFSGLGSGSAGSTSTWG